MPFPKLDFPWNDGGDEEQDNRSDYRPVPASDRGNDGYHDKGMLGFYQTDAEWFRDPAGVKRGQGFGASSMEIERGWCDPGINESPAHELANYKYRSTEPMRTDEGVYGQPGADDFSFRQRNRRSEGFLTRPKLPVER